MTLRHSTTTTMLITTNIPFSEVQVFHTFPHSIPDHLSQPHPKNSDRNPRLHHNRLRHQGHDLRL